jgi:hypothetical protein
MANVWQLMESRVLRHAIFNRCGGNPLRVKAGVILTIAVVGQPPGSVGACTSSRSTGELFTG